MNNQIPHRMLIFCCQLVMLMFIIATPALAHRLTAQRNSESEQMKIAKAAWTPFFIKFRRAISSRDRKALRALLSGDFEGGHYGNGDDLNDTIRVWLDPRDRRAILAAKPSEYLYAKELVGRRDDDNTIIRSIGWRVDIPCCDISFEFRSDGKWYITRFECGCTA